MSKNISTIKNNMSKNIKINKKRIVTDSINKVFNKKQKIKKPIEKTKQRDINNKTSLNITSKNKI
jgi:hypothetical protein